MSFPPSVRQKKGKPNSKNKAIRSAHCSLDSFSPLLGSLISRYLEKKNGIYEKEELQRDLRSRSISEPLGPMYERQSKASIHLGETVVGIPG